MERNNFIENDLRDNVWLKNKIIIDELGRIEIIDDRLLAAINGHELDALGLDTQYLNVSCNGNSGCC